MEAVEYFRPFLDVWQGSEYSSAWQNKIVVLRWVYVTFKYFLDDLWLNLYSEFSNNI